jgi:hypothetical protein
MATAHTHTHTFHAFPSCGHSSKETEFRAPATSRPGGGTLGVCLGRSGSRSHCPVPFPAFSLGERGWAHSTHFGELRLAVL